MASNGFCGIGAGFRMTVVTFVAVPFPIDLFLKVTFIADCSTRMPCITERRQLSLVEIITSMVDLEPLSLCITSAGLGSAL